ncbi:DUF6571 family protein [Streptomyces neyagawaensis]|uniref:DUF6571 family protein n=1 Tax=Streptomyces neyagawaensis TaxID=42238 RepID=A0ABV3B4I7_9ACTN
MDLDALRTADFGLLDDAVEDWSAMVTDLAKLKEDARDGLKGAADKADWAGCNATVTKEFIGRTAAEFTDAHGQAESVRNILRDTRDELKGCHRRLGEALERGRRKKLTVVGHEGGFSVTADVPSEGRAGSGGATGEGAGEEKDRGGGGDRRGDIGALREEIQEILDRATEIDESAGTVLGAIADQSRLGFSDARYQDRDAAARAVREADELAVLARKKPEDLTVAEFDRLDAGLAKYGKDGLFAERFATRLGPRGTLEFWTGITDPSGSYALREGREGRFDDLQRHLSLTLAGASHSDSAAMADWKRDMIGLGETRIGGHGVGPMGFQVMSNLMRVGDYDDAFLTRYGTELMAAERGLTGNGENGNDIWEFGGASGTSHTLNHIGQDSGADPLTGFLKGLSRSPEAATSFLGQEYIAKDDPDNPFERDTDGDGHKGKVSLSTFQYLFEERQWPEEHDSHGDELHTGRNNLALALEAATTGHPAGEMPTADTPAHDARQAKLVESLVRSVAEDPSRLTGHGYMSDSVGQIAAEYMPDIHRGLHAGLSSDRTLFPVAGTAAHLGEQDLTRFLYTLGRNPEGYAAVNLGQHSYTTQLMQYHFEHPDAYVDDPAHSRADCLKDGIGEIARTAGQIQGTIGAGRAYEGEIEGGTQDADYNSVLETTSTWGGTAVGIGVGLATAPVVGPGGIVIGGVAGTAADEIIGAITDGSLKDSAGDVVYRNGRQFQDTADSTYRLVEEAARKAGENTGRRSPLIEATVASSAQDGFDSAATKVHDYLAGEGVPQQLDTDE